MWLVVNPDRTVEARIATTAEFWPYRVITLHCAPHGLVIAHYPRGMEEHEATEAVMNFLQQVNTWSKE